MTPEATYILNVIMWLSVWAFIGIVARQVIASADARRHARRRARRQARHYAPGKVGR